jgi:hypothetical protein
MKELPANTYTYQVMHWLKLGMTLTSRQAINEFGCTRLAAIIKHLKTHYGMPIISEDLKVKNRNGRFVKIARYQLIKE